MKMIRSYTAIIIVLFLIPAVSGCINFVYKQSTIMKAVNKSEKNINKLEKQIHDDMKACQDLYNELVSFSDDINKKPLPELNECLGKMKIYVAEFDKAKKDFEAINSELKTIAGKKKKISDKDPEFELIEKLKSELYKNFDAVEETKEKYENQSKKFKEILKDNKIYRVKVAEFRKQFISNLAKMDKQISKAQKNINKEKNRFEKMKKQGRLNERDIADAEMKFSDMQKTLDEIAAHRLEFDQLLMQFDGSSTGKTEILIAPGTEYSTFYDSFTAKIEEIQKLVKKYNAAAEDL